MFTIVLLLTLGLLVGAISIMLLRDERWGSWLIPATLVLGALGATCGGWVVRAFGEAPQFFAGVFGAALFIAAARALSKPRGART